jgi:hypothetical protein
LLCELAPMDAEETGGGDSGARISRRDAKIAENAKKQLIGVGLACIFL